MAGDRPGDLPACLGGVTNLQGATGPITFSPSGETLKAPKVFRVLNGRCVDFLDSLEQYRLRMLQEIEDRKRGLEAPR